MRRTEQRVWLAGDSYAFAMLTTGRSLRGYSRSTSLLQPFQTTNLLLLVSYFYMFSSNRGKIGK